MVEKEITLERENLKDQVITLDQEKAPEQEITISVESAGLREAYEKGVEDGESIGYDKGKTEGEQIGYTNGLAEGETIGYEKGKTEGEEIGYTEGYAKGDKALWGVLLNNGKEKNHYYAFCYDRFDDKTWNPPYNIVTSNTTTGGQSVFYSSGLITDIKVSIIVKGINIRYIFYDCTLLKTIPLLSVTDKVTNYTDAFKGCLNLENITMSGTIGPNISFADCSKLTHDSLMSIINALKDYSGTTTTRTLTLHATAKARLTTAEIAIATEKGWTLA